MYMFVVLIVFFLTANGSLRNLDGKLPLLDGKDVPLTIDIGVKQFNQQLNDILTQDVPEEISDIFRKFVENEKFKQELQNYSRQILQGAFQNFTGSVLFRQMVKNESKREVDDLNERSKKQSDELNERTKKDIEKLNKTTKIEIEEHQKTTKDQIDALEKQIKYLKMLTMYECKDFKQSQPTATDGAYQIRRKTLLFSVYCDMTTDGGGWTVFQRRIDGSLDFYKNWSEYKVGFGDVTGEFWLGNDKLHQLTASDKYELRIELGDWDGSTRYAYYSSFSIGDEASNYKLKVSGYSGNAGDGLEYSNGRSFSTKDRDNDGYNCAVDAVGAWWYKSCAYSNLNGEYLRGKFIYGFIYGGVNWYYWKGWNYSLKTSKMMIRRK